jgi:cellulose synthase/poly-beta-1,6-N-acetylglucosamine synthase-like glycosyltransferase
MMLFQNTGLTVLIFSLMGLYASCLLFIFLYSMAQAHLVFYFLKRKRKPQSLLPSTSPVDLPYVSIQLPVYNELYVVERLIDAVCAIDYPLDQLEVQILDDSTDETTSLIAKKTAEWRSKGFTIVHQHRDSRKDFKAGALKEGLATSKGEFIAIFDADFIPPKDFLKKTLPYFNSEKIGMVQTRWQHINKDYSFLTKLQAFGLDAHFTIEQSGRNKAGCFINFNGTAGIWRKSCIIDAGNWQADTLTEDLDLSYRAQRKGWNFVYLQEQDCPSELPPVMSALKTQQYRWSKGAAEVARKQLRQVWKADLPFYVRWQATFHLLNSSVFICILITSLLSVPLLFAKNAWSVLNKPMAWASICLLSFIVLVYMYWIASRHSEKTKNKTGRFLIQFPLFLSVMMGLSLHNTIAVAEGFMGKKTPFIRTPKFNIQKKTDAWQRNRYLNKSPNVLTFAEGLLSLFFLFACGLGIYLKDYGLLPLHLMLSFGFGFVCYSTVFE